MSKTKQDIFRKFYLILDILFTDEKYQLKKKTKDISMITKKQQNYTSFKINTHDHKLKIRKRVSDGRPSVADREV